MNRFIGTVSQDCSGPWVRINEMMLYYKCCNNQRCVEMSVLGVYRNTRKLIILLKAQVPSSFLSANASLRQFSNDNKTMISIVLKIHLSHHILDNYANYYCINY